MDKPLLLLQVGELFRGRLPDDVLDSAIDYANFGEWSLSVEMLCDQLYEYAVQLQIDEVEKIRELAVMFNADITRVNHLTNLLQKCPD